MALRPLTTRRRRLLVGAAVLAVFATALVGWVSGPGYRAPKLSPQAQRALANPPVGAPSPSASPSSSAKTTPATPGKARASGPLALLPDLPQSTSVNGADAPLRSVKMTLQSDAAIVQMGYLVRGGKPDRYSDKNVRSPAVITTLARGYGLVAEIGGQASPYATYITCSVTVDGQLHSRHTVRGAWAVAVCMG
jgi:hypothetical protein